MISLNYNLATAGNTGSKAIEYGWLDEATATWAIDLVYPEDNFEHRFLNSYFGLGAWHTEVGQATDIRHEAGYRDYLFFLFLTKSANSNAVMPAIWSATESTGSIQAVDQGLGGQFATKWKDFALELMNREDRDGFETWDDIPDRLPMGSAVGDGDQHLSLSLAGQQTRELPLPQASNFPPNYDPDVSVASKTFAYTSFELPDPSVKQVTLSGYGYRPSSGQDANTRVTAWYKLADGTRHEENWSSGAEQTFCRDKPEENITELVVFYTNGRPTPYLDSTPSVERPTAQGKVELKDACPITGFSGSFSGVSNRSGGGLTDITVTWNGNMHLSLYEGPLGSDVYEADGGVLNVESIEGTVGPCTLDGGPNSYTLPVAGEEPGGQQPLIRIARYPQGWRIGSPWVIGNPPPTIPVTYTCPDDTDTQNDPLLAYGQWLSYHPDFLQLHPQNGLQATNLHVAIDGEWTHDLTYQYLPEYED
jgi:hypothetical protein